MLRDSLKKMLFGCALLMACVSLASAQEISQQKREAVRKLIEVTGTQRVVTDMFKASMTEYQKNWLAAVLANYKEKGLLKSLTPQQATAMEKVIHQFSDDVFGEIKRRVTQELITPESMVELYGPAFDKNFSEAELEEIAAFAQTPTGKKFLEAYGKAMQEVFVATMRAKGMYDVQSSPTAEIAKFDRLREELKRNPVMTVGRILSLAGEAAAGSLTNDERREVAVYALSPTGRRAVEALPALLTEVMIKNEQTYVPQVGKLTEQIIAEQLKVFEQRLYDIFKKGGSRQTAKRAASE